jgi:mannose-6-phosphate isomerase
MNINIRHYGGNTVKQFQLGKLGKELLGSGPYEYFIYETQSSELVNFRDLRSCTVYVLDKPSQAVVTVEGIEHSLDQGDVVQAEDCVISLDTKGGAVKLLVAGTLQPHPNPDIKGLFYTRFADIYKVAKPWGHELWINGQHPCYALKQVYVLAGTKTSLQYHNLKQETNVLFQGKAKLHYKQDPTIANDLVAPDDISTAQIEPVSSVDIMPLTLHRLEAITDITLYETSTPHLDDVVRVSDDNKRPDGRIEKEHER